MISTVHCNLNRHTGILGICWIIYGCVRLVMALWLTTFSTTATLMFGALLTRVPDPFALMSEFHFIYLCVVVWFVVASIVGILAGLALLAGRASSRPVALVAAFLSVSEIPLGITLGVYTLVVLLPSSPERAYASSSQAA